MEPRTLRRRLQLKTEKYRKDGPWPPPLGVPEMEAISCWPISGRAPATLSAFGRRARRATPTIAVGMSATTRKLIPRIQVESLGISEEAFDGEQ